MGKLFRKLMTIMLLFIGLGAISAYASTSCTGTTCCSDLNKAAYSGTYTMTELKDKCSLYSSCENEYKESKTAYSFDGTGFIYQDCPKDYRAIDPSSWVDVKDGCWTCASK